MKGEASNLPKDRSPHVLQGRIMNLLHRPSWKSEASSGLSAKAI